MKNRLIAVVALCLPLSAAADEGMWTLDNFPAEAVEQAYGVTIDSEWLRHAQLATTRLENGCTGSFASEDGLTLTNNHCVWGCVRNLSTADRNLSDEGFLATSRERELQCPGEQLSVLMDYQEVTEQVAEAIAGKEDAAANTARKAELTRLESECEARSQGERSCEAVTLYNGGQYFIYEYKRYDDVRLVFAPELDIAAFGGDPDNFNFPRWSLDMSFLRAYENGEPAQTPHYFSWRAAGPEAGEPVFITGHPGSTDRLLTVSQLRFQRDLVVPIWIERYAELRGRMITWADTSDEAARIVQQRILGYENGLKVRRNALRALHRDEMLARKAEQEQALRDAVAADPALQAQYGEAWELIDRSLVTHRNIYEENLFIENSAGLLGDLYRHAKTLVRGTAERERPNADRIRAYTDSALPGVEQRLLADRPVNREWEILQLRFSLEKMREWLGPDSPWVQTILGDASPAERAKTLIEGSQLDDPAVRKALWEGGTKAVKASDDALIQLALAIDPGARALRTRFEDEVEAPQTRGEEMIADARFQIYGTDTYPDATFTLRVTYGSVVGWGERGTQVPPFTRTARLFERATGERPFRVPDSWASAQERLEPTTPFNYVATTDITGGNSGSPMLAADGSVVGLAFDGNIHSIAGNYWFDIRNNRTVSVNTAIMLEALDKVYGAEALIEELTVK